MKITKIFQYSQPLSIKKTPPKEPVFLGLSKKKGLEADSFLKDKEEIKIK